MLITDIQRRSVSQREEKRERERKSVKLPEHGEFKTSVPRSSKVGNSICGLAVEKFRQFESLPASRGFTVNFFRIFPPRDFRGPLHTAYQRQRSSVSLGNVLSLVPCLTLISLTSFFSRNENLRHVSSSLRLFSPVIHRQWMAFCDTFRRTFGRLLFNLYCPVNDYTAFCILHTLRDNKILDTLKFE